METFIWIIIFVIGLFCFATAYAELYDAKKVVQYGIRVTIRWVIIIIASTITISASMVKVGLTISKTNPPKLHSNKVKLRTEIVVKSINGKEVSRDTIYIFTPKKTK